MKIHQLTASIAAVLLSASLFSCSSDDFFGKAETNTDGISFGVSTENAASTRANNSADGYTAARYTLRSDNSADTLCVRAVVTDGIGNDNAGRPATRAAMLQTSMYDEFKVVAQYKKADGSINSQLYMNETAKRSGSLWSPNSTYYWPEKGQLRFFAWAPTDATLDESPIYPQENVNMTTLKYTASTDLTKQRDLVAAATGEFSNNSTTGAPVNLQFKHICTAVIIKTGETMAEGTIKSVKITKVRNSGTYDMATAAWDLDETTADYTVSPDLPTTGATADGTKLNAEDATFMLLPQTLGADSKLEVVFHDNISGNDRPLSASLSGAKWLMGKTVTYRLSITPEYELKFTSTPAIVDAHYDIIPIKVNTKYVTGNWTIKSNQPWVTIKSALTTYEQSGYWLKATGDYARDYADYCGSEKVPVERQQTLDKTGNGETTLYLFVEENNSTTDRTVTLTLSINGVDFATADIVQRCPIWQGDIGWEVLEDDETFPFGFKWDRKVTYQKEGFGPISGRIEEWWIKQNFKKQPNTLGEWIKSIFVPQTVPYVTVDHDDWKGTVTFTVNYSKMDEISATSEVDGLDNTWKLYSHVGGTSFEGEKYIATRGYKMTEQSGSNEIPKVFAALYAVKLNAFEIHKGGSGDKITYAITPEKKDINWYLPASNQFSEAVGLNGKHWSSTGIRDNSNAYTWDASPQSTPRMDLHKVRAVRKK
ncbi:fimbrillin family protein [Prevotella stercorea]|uniref:fimbrillin family protein n=1 Tax=Leyella stercorea TaxID=363265 RepID=UPI001F3DC98C|nr:fimbrillin family protein [Leyella stercorea]MCF2646312.1 fimbrillin family protein [Leyella stercorea]